MYWDHFFALTLSKTIFLVFPNIPGKTVNSETPSPVCVKPSASLIVEVHRIS